MKKRILSVLLALLMLLTSIILPTETTYQAATDELQLEDALSSYFAIREDEFMSESQSETQAYSITTDLDRGQVLNEWKEELDIELVSVDISYQVNDIIEENDSEIQLMLYEWVFIEYKCNGFDNVEEMGFGTDHIITLSKESDELEIIGDAYSEITGYEVGTEEELEFLNPEEEIVELETISSPRNTVQPYAITSYNASAAVSYSNRWCGVSTSGGSNTQTPSNYNPAYYYYSNDCCNFVSQCLYAGGLSMNSTWRTTTNTSSTPVLDSSISKSTTTWIRVAELVPYLNSRGYVSKRFTSSSPGIAGNLLYWLQSSGYSSNHVMLIVGENSAGNVIVNGHNRDMYRYPISISSSDVYYSVCMAHRYTSATALNATNHQYTCNFCGVTGIAAHSYVGNTCTICGYTK